MKKKIFGFVLAVVLVLSLGAVIYGETGHEYFKMEYLSGTTDTDTVTILPAAEALPKQDEVGKTYTVSSTIPQRDGYEFIDWTLDYGVKSYKVTYVVNPDKAYGTPEGSKVPTDPTEYAPYDYVKVKDQLTTDVKYAYNKAGEKVTGNWTWFNWDKADFEIDRDTTVVGGWQFDPAPAKVYKYTVEYRLWDGKQPGKKVASDKPGEVNSLGEPVTEYAKPMEELNKPYCLKNKQGKYNYRIVTPYMTKVISDPNGGDVIIILYEEIPKGM